MSKIKSLIKKTYQTPVQLTGEDYKNGQAFFILECIGGTSLIRLSQGAFIVGFTTMIGMPPGLIGILSAIPMLAHIFQIFGGIYFGNKSQYKLEVVVYSLIIRMLIGMIYFTPLFVTNRTHQGILLVVIYSIVSFGISFLNPPIISWIMDLSPQSIRGQYFAKREMYTMVIVALSEAVLAKMLDAFKVHGVEALGFNIIGIIIFIWALVSIYAFSAVKEPIRPEKTKKLTIKKDIKLLLKNKDFKKLGILYVIWNFSLYIGMLYIAIYMISTLKMSYLYAMIMSMLTLGFRVLSVKLWGKFVETNSWCKAIEIGVVLIGISTGLLFFANSVTALFILPISHILSGIAWGSIGITFFNLQVMFAPDESRTLYIGALAALSGISGFIATVGSGFFIDMFAHIHINILNFTIGNMQIVFLVSGVLLSLIGIYVKRVIAPMEARKETLKETSMRTKKNKRRKKTRFPLISVMILSIIMIIGIWVTGQINNYYNNTSIVGEWESQETGKIVEFMEDGIVKVDKIKTGDYAIISSDTIRYSIEGHIFEMYYKIKDRSLIWGLIGEEEHFERKGLWVSK